METRIRTTSWNKTFWGEAVGNPHKNNIAKLAFLQGTQIQSLNVCKGLKEALYFGARIRVFLGLWSWCSDLKVFGRYGKGAWYMSVWTGQGGWDGPYAPRPRIPGPLQSMLRGNADQNSVRINLQFQRWRIKSYVDLSQLSVLNPGGCILKAPNQTLKLPGFYIQMKSNGQTLRKKTVLNAVKPPRL